MTEYEKEELALCNFFIDTQLIPKGTKTQFAIAKHDLELILNTKCDQHCKYCYLEQHGDELYPEHTSIKDILHNAELILDYIYNTKYCYFYTIELFGGEIVRNNLIFDIFDMLKIYWDKIKLIEPEIFKYRMTCISIPNNLSFVPEREDLVQKIFKYQQDFEKNYNARIMFSWSCDGPYSADVREQKELDDDYYNSIIEFCDKTDSGYHPMISYEGIDHLKENYLWWLKTMQTKERPPFEFQPMMLEVRNNGWTDESINKYLQFLDFAIEKRLELCHNDPEELAYHFFNGDGANSSLPHLNNYDFLTVVQGSNECDAYESLSCNLQKSVHINCNNLSLVLCHRLTYQHLVGAYFVPDESGQYIESIRPYNLNGYINIHIMKARLHPACDTCDFAPFCLQGCLGSQCETMGDPLMTISSVCNLLQRKIKYLIKLYYKYNLFDYIQNNKFGTIRLSPLFKSLALSILNEEGINVSI